MRPSADAMGVIVSGVVAVGAFVRPVRSRAVSVVVGVVVGGGAYVRPVRSRARQRRCCWWCIRAPGAFVRPSAGLLLVRLCARCVRVPRCVHDGPEG